MARDLLTPDEVKQLHYKTIIFSIIGYPIFRDTVIYSKFSCYKSGEIEREVNSLRKLDYTYFTVEQIKSIVKDIWESQNINVDVRTLKVEESGAVVLSKAKADALRKGNQTVNDLKIGDTTTLIITNYKKKRND